MANGIIDNGTRADEFRTRIPDKMVLNEANKIFITDGTTDSVNNKSIPHVIGKNIIEAVNGAGAVANATHAVNADNATNVVLTTTANADGSTTIKAGTGSARVENCINAKNADKADSATTAVFNDDTGSGDPVEKEQDFGSILGKGFMKGATSQAPLSEYDTTKGSIEFRFKNILGSGMLGIGSAPLEGYNKSKGTIEERLTNLGFKKGTIAELTSNLRVYFDCVLDKDNTYVYKQGNIVWGKITFAPSVNKNCGTTKRTIHVASITTTGFKPHTKISCGVLCFGKSNTNYIEYVKNIMDAYIETDGSVKVTYLAEGSGSNIYFLDLHQMFFAYDVTGNH